VTGVLDWAGFLITDPTLDVAYTITLTTIHGRQYISPPELEKVVENYLDAYMGKRPLSLDHLAYFRALRCVQSLLQGAQGQEYWRMPHAEKELISHIHKITNIRITTPK